jgi:hypothetical protein
MEISSMSMDDYIRLTAHWYYTVDQKFQCHEKKRKIKERIKIPEAQENAIRMVDLQNGCNTISEQVKIRVDNVNYHSCFCRFLHPQFGYYLTLLETYEKGVPPYPGSTSEQPAKIMEILVLLQKLKLEHQEKVMAEQERKNRSKSVSRR